jgi:hypothetical protein
MNQPIGLVARFNYFLSLLIFVSMRFGIVDHFFNVIIA